MYTIICPCLCDMHIRKKKINKPACIRKSEKKYITIKISKITLQLYFGLCKFHYRLFYFVIIRYYKIGKLYFICDQDYICVFWHFNYLKLKLKL